MTTTQKYEINCDWPGCHRMIEINASAKYMAQYRARDMHWRVGVRDDYCPEHRRISRGGSR